jgi:AraC-like DNA-binding protein
MIAELEQIDIESTNLSIQFFKIETKAFVPYWHYHPELELTYILQGEGTRIVGNSIEAFSNNDLVFVGSNTPHHWVSSNLPALHLQKAFVFQFSAAIFKGFKECQHFFTLFEQGIRGIYFKEPSLEIIERITTFENLSAVQRLSALIDLLHSLTQHQSIELLATKEYVARQNHKHNRNKKFSTVNKYILENLNQKLTVQELADVSNMVPQSFCRWFRQHSGYSFITFLNITRIENACQMLMHKNQSVQQIAYSCGFESLSHFNRTFRKYKNQSPREFMNSNLSKPKFGTERP